MAILQSLQINPSALYVPLSSKMQLWTHPVFNTVKYKLVSHYVQVTSSKHVKQWGNTYWHKIQDYVASELYEPISSVKQSEKQLF